MPDHAFLPRVYAAWDGRRSRALRAMYATGRGNRTARRMAHLWSRVFALGLQPRRWVTLEVRGAKSGELRHFPLGMADLHGQWYLVSMLGECAWTRNVRAAQGRARVLHRRARPVLLTEVPVEERAPILQRYLDVVPGGRPHIPVPVGSPVEAFEQVAATYPAFRITWLAD